MDISVIPMTEFVEISFYNKQGYEKPLLSNELPPNSYFLNRNTVVVNYAIDENQQNEEPLDIKSLIQTDKLNYTVEVTQKFGTVYVSFNDTDPCEWLERFFSVACSEIEPPETSVFEETNQAKWKEVSRKRRNRNKEKNISLKSLADCEFRDLLILEEFSKTNSEESIDSSPQVCELQEVTSETTAQVKAVATQTSYSEILRNFHFENTLKSFFEQNRVMEKKYRNSIKKYPSINLSNLSNKCFAEYKEENFQEKLKNIDSNFTAFPAKISSTCSRRMYLNKAVSLCSIFETVHCVVRSFSFPNMSSKSSNNETTNCSVLSEDTEKEFPDSVLLDHSFEDSTFDSVLQNSSVSDRRHRTGFENSFREANTSEFLERMNPNENAFNSFTKMEEVHKDEVQNEEKRGSAVDFGKACYIGSSDLHSFRPSFISTTNKQIKKNYLTISPQKVLKPSQRQDCSIKKHYERLRSKQADKKMITGKDASEANRSFLYSKNCTRANFEKSCSRMNSSTVFWKKDITTNQVNSRLKSAPKTLTNTPLGTSTNVENLSENTDFTKVDAENVKKMCKNQSPKSSLKSMVSEQLSKNTQNRTSVKKEKTFVQQQSFNHSTKASGTKIAPKNSFLKCTKPFEKKTPSGSLEPKCLVTPVNFFPRETDNDDLPQNVLPSNDASSGFLPKYRNRKRERFIKSVSTGNLNVSAKGAEFAKKPIRNIILTSLQRKYPSVGLLPHCITEAALRRKRQYSSRGNFRQRDFLEALEKSLPRKLQSQYSVKSVDSMTDTLKGWSMDGFWKIKMMIKPNTSCNRIQVPTHSRDSRTLKCISTDGCLKLKIKIKRNRSSTPIPDIETPSTSSRSFSDTF